MYIPKCFAESDVDILHQAIEQHSFATLVSMEGSTPTASHLPFLLDRDSGAQGVLIGHMARANCQWESAKDQAALVIFQGPHTYISPSWYHSEKAVPTWNYVAVHVYGTFRLVTEANRMLEILNQTVDFYEASLPKPWSLDHTDSEFIKGLLSGIVGFEIDIERIEGKWKLNQNHDTARRTRVIQALQQRGGENREQIADLMAKTLE